MTNRDEIKTNVDVNVQKLKNETIILSGMLLIVGVDS